MEDVDVNEFTDECLETIRNHEKSEKLSKAYANATVSRKVHESDLKILDQVQLMGTWELADLAKKKVNQSITLNISKEGEIEFSSGVVTFKEKQWELLGGATGTLLEITGPTKLVRTPPLKTIRELESVIQFKVTNVDLGEPGNKVCKIQFGELDNPLERVTNPLKPQAYHDERRYTKYLKFSCDGGENGRTKTRTYIR